jgi:4-hydroxybenzoate polyprenyltransferase
MVTARSAAMTFNRLADARLDATNPRTSHRPIQTGRVSMTMAWAFYAACCAGFVLACAGFWWAYRNAWPITLSLPVLAFISAYSLAKRVTWLCHLMLGAALGIAPMAAWLAVSPQTWGAPAVVLAAAVVCWVAGFDIIYALQDIAIDRRDRLHSLPADLGPAGALWVSRALHAATVGLLVLLGAWLGLGWIYYAGLVAAAITLTIEQSIVNPRNFRRVNAAFFLGNAIVSLVLAGATIADIFFVTR